MRVQVMMWPGWSNEYPWKCSGSGEGGDWDEDGGWLEWLERLEWMAMVNRMYEEIQDVEHTIKWIGKQTA